MGQAHDAGRCAKRTCCRIGKGRFAACSGRNSTGIFFSLHICSSIQAFLSTSVSRPMDSTRPDHHFFLSGNAPGGVFCPIFVMENAPDTLQTPQGRYFGIVLWNAPGGVYSVLYGNRIPVTVQRLLRSRAERCSPKIHRGFDHPRRAGAPEGALDVDGTGAGYGLRSLSGVGHA